MKALTVYQPSAILIPEGYQTILTRSSDSDHRGWLAIHAAQERNADEYALLDIWPTNDVMTMINHDRIAKGWPSFFRGDMGWASTKHPSPGFGQEIGDGLPRGAITGLVWLARTERADLLPYRWNRSILAQRLPEVDYNDVPALEAMWSDFGKGRTAYWLSHPIALKDPIPCDGWPGIWDIDEPTEQTMLDALLKQGILLPDSLDPGFWRMVQRRGISDGRPSNA